ncbi:MAG: hypothetical protein Q8O61_05040 [Nocardioides sp.]|nr:hypothetical protein [Nocardioides sp.]
MPGTTAHLLLAVFTVVNVACLVLRRDPPGRFRAPTVIPVLGALSCAYLLGPWARLAESYVQYRIAGVLLGIGIVLWALTWLTNRGVRAKKTGFRDIEHLEK